jgi:hypothetical protein|tara:strand:+ start:1217 stop:1396 length:180 start_codon:yes stop_codon:yes gene_type:complete
MINKVPEDMDVPAIRRDISKMENIRWMLRNLAIRNGEHPLISETLDALKVKVKIAEGWE